MKGPLRRSWKNPLKRPLLRREQKPQRHQRPLRNRLPLLGQRLPLRRLNLLRRSGAKVPTCVRRGALRAASR